MSNLVQENTAILIFANSATREFKQKTFAKDSLLFKKLNKETLRKVQKTGIPYFHYTENEQSGSSFGERFINSIEEIYNKGYTNVIAIGNDSPQLRTAHILEAHQQLKLGNTVLGPTFDGGFYLLGLHRSNFNPMLLRQLPWQRFALFNCISRLFENKGLELFRLPLLQDIDTQKDIVVLHNFTKSLSITIKALLASILKVSPTSLTKDPIGYITPLGSSFYNKGSPLYFIEQ